MVSGNYSTVDPLTQREKEVLQLIFLGMSNREIAHVLFLSPKTVENHVNHILNKLDVSSRGKAAAFALQLGLVTLANEYKHS